MGGLAREVKRTIFLCREEKKSPRKGNLTIREISEERKPHRGDLPGKEISEEATEWNLKYLTKQLWGGGGSK